MFHGKIIYWSYKVRVSWEDEICAPKRNSSWQDDHLKLLRSKQDDHLKLHSPMAVFILSVVINAVFQGEQLSSIVDT